MMFARQDGKAKGVMKTLMSVILDVKTGVSVTTHPEATHAIVMGLVTSAIAVKLTWTSAPPDLGVCTMGSAKTQWAGICAIAQILVILAPGAK